MEVLGLERLGIEDNFFRLGGHSLLALRVISRIRQQLDIDAPLSALFEAPSVAEMAIKLSELQAATLDDDDLASLFEGIESPAGDSADSKSEKELSR
jgi:acyl carrier protein